MCEHNYQPVIKQAITHDDFYCELRSTPMFAYKHTVDKLTPLLEPKYLGALCNKCGKFINETLISEV